MANKIKLFRSVRTRLFLSLCIIVISIIISLILLNNFVLREFYEYNKEKQLQNVYLTINDYYNHENHENNLSDELDTIAINNNFDILIRNNENVSIYSSNKDYYSTIGEIVLSIFREQRNQGDILKSTEKYTISKIKDNKKNINYIMLIATLDNSYNLYIRMPVASIEESVSKHFAIEDSVLGLTVKYENNSKRDVTVLDGFLDGLEKLMPGDTLNQLVEIENHSKEDMEYFLYMNNDGLTEREKELLGRITLKIVDQNNNVIYEGNLLEDKAIFLGKFAKGEKNNLIFEIKIPDELDDEFSGINIHSIWSFFAQEDKNDRGITKDNALFSPKTGDYEFELSIVIFFASSIGLIIVLFLNKKEKENMNRNKK